MSTRSEGSSKPSKSGSAISPRLVAVAVLGVLALVFVLQNNDKGRIQFLFFDFTVRIWVALLVTLLVGVVIGYLARGGNKAKQKK